jgi:hypothetical protein
MGKDNHNSSSKKKNSLPQTPKTMKTSPGTAREEFSREFTELINKNLNNDGKAKASNQRNKNNK